MTQETNEGIRLQKVLAQAGYGSRRKCEALIDAGRVSVNGELVATQGKRVDPQVDVIRIDGERIQPPPAVSVLALNKPVGVLTAMSDDRGRPCVGDLLTTYDRTLRGYFHIGRLDQETTGLLLFTNDGNLAQTLAHPSNGVTKTYVATVQGDVRSGTVRRLKEGVAIDGRKVEVSKLRVRANAGSTSLVELSIHEGRKHIVRRLLDEVGHPVLELTRTQFGPISLAKLANGQFRDLTEAETAALFDAADKSTSK